MGRTRIYSDKEREERRKQYQQDRQAERYEAMGVKNFYEGVRPGTLAYKVLNDVKEGIQETVHGFSKKYRTTDKVIYDALTHLRSKGHFIHPIGTVYGGPDIAQSGILKDVTENKEDFIEADNNLQKFQVNPAIERNYHRLEVFITKNPQHYKFGLEAAKMLEHKALEAKKRHEAQHVKSNT